jgi:hypothetical protein|nr:MAG TPA: hypothetical protein [Caudoviricetes sp.]
MKAHTIRFIKPEELPEIINTSHIAQNWVGCGIDPADLAEGLEWLAADPMDGSGAGLTRELFMFVDKTEIVGCELVAKSAHLVRARRSHIGPHHQLTAFYSIDDNALVTHHNRSASLNALERI